MTGCVGVFLGGMFGCLPAPGCFLLSGLKAVRFYMFLPGCPRLLEAPALQFVASSRLDLATPTSRFHRPSSTTPLAGQDKGGGACGP